MKILFANCGYLTGLTGQYNEYILLVWRYVFENTPVSVVLVDTIKHEDPDVCVFVEMKQKSIALLNSSLPEYVHTITVEKYGTGIFSKIGKRNVHAVLSKRKFDDIEKVLFSFGTKKTILRVSISGIEMYICHLSLNKKVRRTQIKELTKLTYGDGKVIIAGDFNSFGGLEEIQPLLELGAMYNLNKNKTSTFPSFNPTKELDYIFASKDIYEKEFMVLPEVFSDHRALYCIIE